MKIIWITDPHINHVTIEKQNLLLNDILKENPTHIFLTGDIENNRNLNFLLSLSKIAKVYFILGNHDFYGNSFNLTNKKFKRFASKNKDIFYLTNLPPIELNKNICIIGHDGWYDLLNGDFWNTRVYLNDFNFIYDLKYQNKNDLFDIIQTINQKFIKQARYHLKNALKKYDKIFFLTHVPPFKEASFYLGKQTSDYYLPFFSCKTMGEMILDVMKNYKNKKLIVLCGHTHSEGFYKPNENITVEVGKAEYGKIFFKDISEYLQKLD